MNREQIIRAWKDEEYRSALSDAELAALPENPAGIVEITGEELGLVRGQSISIDISIAISIAVSFNVLTNVVSCYHCENTIFEGGTCNVGGAGCNNDHYAG